jgi:regulatory protein
MTPEPRISKLQIIRKRSGQRVVVELDSGETIEIDPEIAVRHHLASDTAIPGELIEQLRQEDERLRARRRLIGYLSLRVKSVADARLYLERAGFGESAVTAAIEHATERGLLDDRRFAERFVRTKIKAAAVGPVRLVHELVAHGIEPLLAEQVIEKEFGRDQQIEVAGKVAAKRIKRRLGKNHRDEVETVFDLLMRKGFDKDVAAEVAERATGWD